MSFHPRGHRPQCGLRLRAQVINFILLLRRQGHDAKPSSNRVAPYHILIIRPAKHDMKYGIHAMPTANRQNESRMQLTFGDIVQKLGSKDAQKTLKKH
ncbi:MAG: hypothetical protein AAGF79_20730 [Pseudomonadota bacterium]